MLSYLTINSTLFSLNQYTISCESLVFQPCSPFTLIAIFLLLNTTCKVQIAHMLYLKETVAPIWNVLDQTQSTSSVLAMCSNMIALHEWQDSQKRVGEGEENFMITGWTPCVSSTMLDPNLRSHRITREGPLAIGLSSCRQTSESISLYHVMLKPSDQGWVTQSFFVEMTGSLFDKSVIFDFLRDR